MIVPAEKWIIPPLINVFIRFVGPRIEHEAKLLLLDGRTNEITPLLSMSSASYNLGSIFWKNQRLHKIVCHKENSKFKLQNSHSKFGV